MGAKYKIMKTVKGGKMPVTIASGYRRRTLSEFLGEFIKSTPEDYEFDIHKGAKELKDMLDGGIPKKKRKGV